MRVSVLKVKLTFFAAMRAWPHQVAPEEGLGHTSAAILEDGESIGQPGAQAGRPTERQGHGYPLRGTRRARPVDADQAKPIENGLRTAGRGPAHQVGQPSQFTDESREIRGTTGQLCIQMY